MGGRQRRSFTDDYAASGRSGCFERPLDRVGGQGTWPARFGVTPLGGTAWGWAGADGGVAAPHNAGDAAVGGPRGGDRPFAARERAAADGARHFKKLSSAWRACAGWKQPCAILRGWEGSGRSIIGGTIPVKKHGPWVHANLRVVTSPWRRSRLGR